MTESWDPSIPEHKELAHAIEFGNGIPEMRPMYKSRQALLAVGFEVEYDEDLAERPDEVPWYYPLEGDIRKAQTFWDYFTVWRMSWSGKLVTHNALRILELFRLIPKGTWEVGEALKVGGDALVKGGQTKVCVTSRLNCILIETSSSSSLRCILLFRGSPLNIEQSLSIIYTLFLVHIRYISFSGVFNDQ
jgi:hypothetical protein